MVFVVKLLKSFFGPKNNLPYLSDEMFISNFIINIFMITLSVQSKDNFVKIYLGSQDKFNIEYKTSNHNQGYFFTE